MAELKISGLATGMDIESIVDELMTAERIPLDNLYKDKQILEWQQEDYREINKLLFDFRDKVFDLKLEGTFDDKSVTSSNENAVQVSASSNANEGIYQFSISQMAKGVYKSSLEELAEETDEDGNTLSLNSQFNLGGTEEQAALNEIKEILQNMQELAVESAGDTLTDEDRQILQEEFEQLSSEIASLSQDKTFDITIDIDGLDISSQSSASTAVDTLNSELEEVMGELPQDIIFTLEGFKNGESTEEIFSFNIFEDNIYDVVNEINSRDMGITASYDRELNRFFLTTSTGSESKIVLKEDDAAFFEKLKLDIALYNESDPATVYTGQDAVVEFGGAEFEFASNNFSINGLNFTLQDEPVSSENPLTVNITVNNDTDGVYEKIKDFVDTYNEVIEKINSKLQEEKYSDYDPLTDEQKEEMTDEEIELWEEKARSGLLRNDSILNSIVSDMRVAMSGIVENVSGKYDSLDEIGISTKNWYENGKLYIDEDQLKEALSNDADSVLELFTNSSTVEAEKGVAKKLYDVVLEGTELLTDKAGQESSLSLVDNSYIGIRLSSMDEDIDDWLDRLTEIENRYWEQFTAMEVAISEMNTQSAWLTQQFSS